MILMRILIYGAGVIGSLYAALFAEAGYDTNMYQHAMKAPDEMRELHKQFYAYLKE